MAKGAFSLHHLGPVLVLTPARRLLLAALVLRDAGRCHETLDPCHIQARLGFQIHNLEPGEQETPALRNVLNPIFDRKIRKRELGLVGHKPPPTES